MMAFPTHCSVELCVGYHWDPTIVWAQMVPLAQSECFPKALLLYPLRPFPAKRFLIWLHLRLVCCLEPQPRPPMTVYRRLGMRMAASVDSWRKLRFVHGG